MWKRVAAQSFVTALFAVILFLAVSVYGQSRFMQGAAAYERWLSTPPCKKTGELLPNQASFRETHFEAPMDSRHTD